MQAYTQPMQKRFDEFVKKVLLAPKKKPISAAQKQTQPKQ